MYLYPTQQDIALLRAHGSTEFSSMTSMTGRILFTAPGYPTYARVIDWEENARHNANWKTGQVIDYFLKAYGLTRYGFRGVGAIIAVGDTLTMQGYQRIQAFEVLCLADIMTAKLSSGDPRLGKLFPQIFARCARISSMEQFSPREKIDLAMIDMPVEQISELVASGTPVSYILQLHPPVVFD
jgi:hypothetical protein